MPSLPLVITTDHAFEINSLSVLSNKFLLFYRNNQNVCVTSLCNNSGNLFLLHARQFNTVV